RFGNVANLVGKADLGGVPDVAGVLDHLGNLDGLADDGGVQILINLRQKFTGSIVELTDHGHWRVVIIHNGGALTEKLRVNTHTEINPRSLTGGLLQSRNYHITNGSGQHRAPHRHQVPVTFVAQGITNVGTHLFHILQVKIAVGFAGGAHTDHRQLTLLNRHVTIGNAV